MIWRMTTLIFPSLFSSTRYNKRRFFGWYGGSRRRRCGFNVSRNWQSSTARNLEKGRRWLHFHTETRKSWFNERSALNIHEIIEQLKWKCVAFNLNRLLWYHNMLNESLNVHLEMLAINVSYSRCHWYN